MRDSASLRAGPYVILVASATLRHHIIRGRPGLLHRDNCPASKGEKALLSGSCTANAPNRQPALTLEPWRPTSTRKFQGLSARGKTSQLAGTGRRWCGNGSDRSRFRHFDRCAARSRAEYGTGRLRRKFCHGLLRTRLQRTGWFAAAGGRGRHRVKHLAGAQRGRKARRRLHAADLLVGPVDSPDHDRAEQRAAVPYVGGRPARRIVAGDRGIQDPIARRPGAIRGRDAVRRADPGHGVDAGRAERFRRTAVAAPPTSSASESTPNAAGFAKTLRERTVSPSWRGRVPASRSAEAAGSPASSAGRKRPKSAVCPPAAPARTRDRKTIGSETKTRIQKRLIIPEVCRRRATAPAADRTPTARYQTRHRGTVVWRKPRKDTGRSGSTDRATVPPIRIRLQYGRYNPKYGPRGTATITLIGRHSLSETEQ